MPNNAESKTTEMNNPPLLFSRKQRIQSQLSSELRSSCRSWKERGEALICLNAIDRAEGGAFVGVLSSLLRKLEMIPQLA